MLFSRLVWVYWRKVTSNSNGTGLFAVGGLLQ
jgi:hypothetical protein